MIFNFFKKEESDLVKIITLIKSGNLQEPKKKDKTIKLSREEFILYSNHRHEIFKTTEMLPEDKHPSLYGVIVGYHPYPKDIITALTAVVEWPCYEKSKKTFVVDCSLLARGSSPNLTYPGEGTWIIFRELGKTKDADGTIRAYGMADTVFSSQLINIALKASGKKL
jgi:hypothetical protein